MLGPGVRKDSKYLPLSKDEFRSRFEAQFYDPAFEHLTEELNKVFEVAWDGYINYRKSPRKLKAGADFADADFELPAEWLETYRNLQEAEKKQKDASLKTRILLINGSPRSQHSCPGEISKTRRLVKKAQEVFGGMEGIEVDELDLSLLEEEPYKRIFPCKACVSTSMTLCHWPCSCYPNHALGQTQDWMNELYPRWVAAHAVMIICPVHWYQAPTVLKAMMDRLVCADGGNPDPTTTQGKDPKEAKSLELKGWPYPKHLAGRAFSVVTHGDAEGPETLKRLLSDWLTDLDFIDAGSLSQVGRYIGYYKPYATSHNELDEDEDIFIETENAAKSLVEKARQIRSGEFKRTDSGIKAPRKK